jgi:hypothetical protein
MKEVKLGKHKVMLYNSIDELPIVRFHKYNKCLLVDAGLGSDLSAVDGHIERAVRFINGGHKQEAATEMENIRQTIYLIIQGMNPRHLAFAALVKEIDGKACDDISDEGLQRTLELLGDVPVKEMTAENEAVKKKIDEELTLYFPDVFDSATEKEYHDLMKRRTQAMLDAVIEGETAERTAEIERLTERLEREAKCQYALCGQIVDLKEQLAIARAEAVREFAERLNKMKVKIFGEYLIYADNVDVIAEKMTEGEK